MGDAKQQQNVCVCVYVCVCVVVGAMLSVLLLKPYPCEDDLFPRKIQLGPSQREAEGCSPLAFMTGDGRDFNTSTPEPSTPLPLQPQV